MRRARTGSSAATAGSPASPPPPRRPRCRRAGSPRCLRPPWPNAPPSSPPPPPPSRPRRKRFSGGVLGECNPLAETSGNVLSGRVWKARCGGGGRGCERKNKGGGAPARGDDASCSERLYRTRVGEADVRAREAGGGFRVVTVHDCSGLFTTHKDS